MMLATIKADVHPEGELRLNIGDIKKFTAAVKCIQEDEITLEVNSNTVSYTSGSISFRVHMMEDIAMTAQKYTRKRLDKYDGETKFVIKYDDFKSFLQSMACMNGVNKVYLSTANGVVYCTQTDKLIPNTDSMETILSNTYTGNPLTEDVIICTDIFRILAGMKFTECELAINTQGLVIITVRTDNSVVKYYVTSQVQ
jgi:hypothetical protein